MERPDLDQIYMTAVQMMTGQGGLADVNVPDAGFAAVYGGTYFPPDDRYGRPSFQTAAVWLWWTAWKSRRAEVTQQAGQITEHLKGPVALPPGQGDLQPELLRHAVSALGQAFDSRSGASARTPKFPHAMELRVLLRAWKRFGSDEALHMARLTFDRHGYGRDCTITLGAASIATALTSAGWCPTSRKCSYDNALLSLAYWKRFKRLEKVFIAKLSKRRWDYVLREMTSPEGPFFSTQDADSEGVGGEILRLVGGGGNRE